MATSDEWFEYHLTPRGWQMGSSKTDFTREDKEPPSDRVLTVRLSEYLSSSYRKMDHGNAELWRASDAERVAALVQQFGPLPRSDTR